MNRPRGFTLIEMMVVVSVGATLAGIAVLMLYALMKSHDTGREHMENCRVLNRLAEQFRADVHAMKQTSQDDKQSSFDLLPETAGDIKIRYQCIKDRIDRSELQGEKVVRQESYMLPPDVETSFKTQSQQDATIACIVISPKNKMGTGSEPREVPVPILYSAPVRIEAVLGHDLRLSKIKSRAEGKP